MSDELNNSPSESMEAVQETNNRLHNFTLSDFKKSIDDMIATSNKSYQSIYNINRSHRVRDYDAKLVKNIIENGSPQAQQELSYNYFLIDGFYRRIIIYYATFLLYRGVLIPNAIGSGKISDKSLSKRYQKALEFVDMMDIPNICINFATQALIYGTYYGVIQTLDKDNFTILDLPVQYCYTRYKDTKNNDVIEFDLSYFDSISDDVQRGKALSVYPKEIAQAYKRWKDNKGLKIYRIPSDIGICFPFYDGRPFFLSTIPEIINYRDYQTMEKKKDEGEIKKILVQQIPHITDGKLLFEPEEALEMHRGAVDMMRNNEDVSVLTTYADVDLKGSSGVNESISKNNLEKIAQTVYRTAGVSAQLFAATGNMALTSSIQNDLALMMSLAGKFGIFLTNILNRLFSTPQINFKYNILPISYYNNKDYLDMVYKGSSSGYSLLLPAIAMGMNQRDIVSIKQLENDLLNLTDMLIPPSNAYTGGVAGQAGPGRPTKDDDKKSDKTIQNIEAGASSGTTESEEVSDG